MIVRDNAGFDVRNKDIHAYKDRVKELVLPGNKKTDFICGDCAGKEFTVECLQHGEVSGSWVMGLPPTCQACKKEKLDIEKGEI